ncbi:SusC/RagA family TonB-linked outer membrane protein [Dyadobacter fanqingshengii]|uniref:SusC/RagA family TonB-linked outer membrane protein n=1 Tax=Dyadobacter fanqingshengii TaxID=2906443 RepID=A0A9X1PE53_9BACT|nr:SusC/RagA family TonB-linked outer membrane protein [Dyadobacter fanqingshengii]MCF0042902.1 SusC/RagA family TonB-linked outer membrane protein [Dyadobacter fanqingshengii]USJ35458.1 SusC/RagA family TonB-linked outer membrane protein [Dyadobacter fanqingshengii]
MDPISIISMRRVFWCLLAMLLFTGTEASALAGEKPKNTGQDQSVARVRGTVTSAVDGAVVPGVNVLVKGTQLGTTTDAAGTYSIDADGNDAVLVFSYIGFNTTEVAVQGKSVIDVVLEENVATLQEAVVTALGIKRETRSLGYNVGKVEGKDVANVANENVLTSLSGRVSGVSINQTSGIGSSISIIIRGAASLKNNQPLFVVDGVPLANSLANVSEKGSGNRVDYGNAISDINPDDIESMSVLKGPSAAALYGSRAGNGVILITTKSGKKGKGLGVSFSTSNVFEKPYRFLDLHYKYANGERPFQLDESSAYWGGLPLDVGNKEVQWNSPLDENGNPIPTELKSYKNNMKNFLQTGITSTNNLTVSGSTDKSTYRVSYNNMINRGLIPNSDLYRNGLSLAGTFDMAKNLKLSTNINFVRSSSNSRPQTSERDGNPLQAVYYSSSYDINDLKGVWKPGLEEIEQMTVAKGETDNPYFLAKHLTNAYTRDRLYGNIKLDWTIAPGLTAFARYSHDMYDEDRETKIPWSYKSMAKGGYYLENIGRNESNADFLITKTIKASDFDISISGGGNIMQQHGNSSNLGGRDLSVPGLYNISNIPVGNRIVGNGSYKKAIYSLYALSSIGFKNQLYLDLTARNDWSSTLPESNRSYFYPSASLSWLASTTFNMPSAVSLLKFRGGWAQVGNDTDPYQLYPNLGTGNWGDLVTANLGDNLLNPTLLPEIATSTEGGIDLNLFNNRLRFDITYYDRANTNQIFSVPMAPSTGYASKNINAGKLVSRGWEIGLGGTPISNRGGWSLDLNANFSRNRVTVKELAPNFPYFEQWSENGAGAYTFVGEQIGNMYSRGFATVQDKDSPYYRWPIIAYDGEGGDMDWQALGGRENNVKVGNYNPDFLVGMQANLTYKRFSLGLSFDWRQGGEFMSFTYRYGESDWKSQRQIDNLIPGSLYTPDELVALLKSDPEKYIIPQNGNFPRVGGHTAATGGFGPDGDGAFIPGVWQDEAGNYHEWLGGTGTKYLPITAVYPWSFNQQVTFDASFVKLREVTLSYKIPNLFGVVRNANLSLYTRNIMLWTASKIGIDPERAFWADPNKGGFRQGIERQNVMPWTIPFGFKLNFDF